jgi:drug/metabolite transporter (DMT)-like permease
VSRRGWILLLALGAVWGVPYLFIKVAVEAGVSPAAVVLARSAIGALVLLPLALRGAGFAVLRGRWRAVLAFAALEILGPWVLFSHAEATLASSTTGLLVATVPLLSVVVGRVAGDRARVPALRWAGLVVGFVGVPVLTGQGVVGGHGIAVMEVLLGALGYAIAPVIAERALQGVPASVLTTACLGVATAVYAPVVLLTGPQPVPPAPAIGALVTLGLVCTALAFLLFFRLIGEVGGPRATLVAYLNPVVAVLLGAAVLAEPLTGSVAVGTLLILGGSALAAARRPADGPVHAAAEPAAEAAGVTGGDAAPVVASVRPRRPRG